MKMPLANLIVTDILNKKYHDVVDDDGKSIWNT
jgi:hypothetical protein